MEELRFEQQTLLLVRVRSSRTLLAAQCQTVAYQLRADVQESAITHKRAPHERRRSAAFSSPLDAIARCTRASLSCITLVHPLVGHHEAIVWEKCFSFQRGACRKLRVSRVAIERASNRSLVRQ